jgi:hypothetical protein
MNYRKQGLVERLASPNYERNVWYFTALLCMGLFFIFFFATSCTDGHHSIGVTAQSSIQPRDSPIKLPAITSLRKW